MTTLEEATKKLMNVDRSSSTPEVIEQLLKECWFKPDIPISIYQLSKGPIVLRIRVIDKGQLIQFEDELSYPPDELNTKFQRASTPDLNMFYGIIAPNYPESFVVCLAETCKIFRENNPESEEIELVISEWTAKEDTEYLPFPNLNAKLNKSNIFQALTPGFKVELAKAELVTATRGVTKLFEYMNDEFTKPANTESDYWVTSKTVELMLKNSDKYYDGVVYESTQAIDERLTEVKCLAIRSESIDYKFKFEKATLYSLYFNSETMKATTKKIKELTITKRNIL